eukprot:UN29875
MRKKTSGAKLKIMNLPKHWNHRELTSVFSHCTGFNKVIVKGKIVVFDTKYNAEVALSQMQQLCSKNDK